MDAISNFNTVLSHELRCQILIETVEKIEDLHPLGLVCKDWNTWTSDDYFMKKICEKLDIPIMDNLSLKIAYKPYRKLHTLIPVYFPIQFAFNLEQLPESNIELALFMTASLGKLNCVHYLLRNRVDLSTDAINLGIIFALAHQKYRVVKSLIYEKCQIRGVEHPEDDLDMSGKTILYHQLLYSNLLEQKAHPLLIGAATFGFHRLIFDILDQHTYPARCQRVVAEHQPPPPRPRSNCVLL